MDFRWLVKATKPILSSLDVVNPITKSSLAGFGMYFFIFGDESMNSRAFKCVKNVVVTCVIRGCLGCVAGT
jgi:hypothetical protein